MIKTVFKTQEQIEKEIATKLIKTNHIRTHLENLYLKIKEYDEKIVKLGQERKIAQRNIEKTKKELEQSNKLTKLERMKKQMDLILSEKKIQKMPVEIDEKIEKDILSKIKILEFKIYFACRYNTTWCGPEIKKLDRKEIKKIYTKSYREVHKNVINERSNCVIEELKPIYEYYKNSFKILEDDEEKLDMLEELIDEMAAEVIREDMKKNNVTLPNFVKGMRYFKSIDEENIENSEIVD